MINKLHSIFFRPETGWDPISFEYAQSYSEKAWQRWEESSLDRLEEIAGGFKGKSVLDMAAGPGQCSISFALRGAEVTWYDVSENYRKIAQRKAAEFGIAIDYVKGYLDEAAKVLNRKYDIVFNRISWCYCMNDKKFAEVIYNLIKPGGLGYVEVDNSHARKWNIKGRFKLLLNKWLWIKIGHPYPPHGRVASLFNNYPISKMIVDYSDPKRDKIIIKT